MTEGVALQMTEGVTYEIWLYKIILIPLSSSIAMTYPCYMSILSNALTKRHQGSGIALAGGLMGISWTLSGSFSGLIANIADTVELTF
ncbi:hypothetical protein PsalSR1_02098 [Piscirickettsia salmonis]|uniref:hypothetical protein n=1 Tax=Piscirickettsia salmonis TaxID=1238 RepID=UPI0012D8F942|nr:hypothetical protein [Piscirickettsia salmonis]QGP54657.1 hypothetical protein PsalSR1_02098 [Piscirickettsia salmonis]